MNCDKTKIRNFCGFLLNLEAIFRSPNPFSSNVIRVYLIQTQKSSALYILWTRRELNPQTQFDENGLETAPRAHVERKFLPQTDCIRPR